MRAASRLEPLDPSLARETYLEALGGCDGQRHRGRRRRAGRGGRRTIGASWHGSAAVVDVLLDAFAIRLTEGYAAAAPIFARALEYLFALDLASEEGRRWLSLSGARNTTSSPSSCGTTRP